jgi:hypothetical protein
MARYKGRQNAKAVEQAFPHFVDIAVPPGGLGKTLDAMYEFHTRPGINADLRPDYSVHHDTRRSAGWMMPPH